MAVGAVWVLYEAFGKTAVLALIFGGLALYLYLSHRAEAKNNAKDLAHRQFGIDKGSIPSQSHTQPAGAISTKAPAAPIAPDTANDGGASANSSSTFSQISGKAKINLRGTSAVPRANIPKGITNRIVAVETFRERMEREKREKGVRKALIKLLVIVVAVGGLVLVGMAVWNK